MSTAAYAAQGTKLEIGATVAAKNITALSKANPAVATITAHGLADGALVKIASVGGMTEINGKMAIIGVVDANTVQFLNIDSTGYGTYTSGGTATGTLAKAINVTGFSGFDGQAGEIDVTDFDSKAKEYLGGLKDSGQVTFNVQISDTDDGQNALRASQDAGGVVTPFTLTFRNGKKRTFNGFVRSFSEQGAVDGVVTGTVAIRISGVVTRA